MVGDLLRAQCLIGIEWPREVFQAQAVLVVPFSSVAGVERSHASTKLPAWILGAYELPGCVRGDGDSIRRRDFFYPTGRWVLLEGAPLLAVPQGGL